ncbi:MAG TPA: hypothetical protein VLI54_04060 [Bacillota bacterium]|nr:hypothetical protein [Bacillota bacterium]
MTDYTGETAFRAGDTLYWNEIIDTPPDHSEATPNTKVAHQILHELVDTLDVDNHVLVMSLPPEEYHEEPVRKIRRHLRDALGATAASCLRNDVSGSPGQPNGIVVHRGALGEKQIITVARTVTVEDQPLRQLSVHNLKPAHSLLTLVNALGGRGIRTTVTNPPESIASVLQLVNEYSPSEKALARIFLAGGRTSPEQVQEVLAVANRWTAPDRHGLWLASLYVKDGYTLPAHLDPALVPYADRLRQYPIDSEQDVLLFAKQVEDRAASFAEQYKKTA